MAEDTRLRQRRFAKVLAGSLLIYAVPLVGPHASWLIIEALIADVTRASGHKPLGWIALDYVAARRAGSTGAASGMVLARRWAARFALLASAGLVLALGGRTWLLPSTSIEPDIARGLRLAHRVLRTDVALASCARRPVTANHAARPMGNPVWGRSMPCSIVLGREPSTLRTADGARARGR
jgi:hypothetical protein